MIFRGVVWTPSSPLDPRMEQVQCLHLLRYTETPSYRAHRLLYNTAYFLSHAQITFFPEFLKGLIWIQTVFLQMYREREWCMHILLGKSKCMGGWTSRERERGVCFLSEFLHFFNSENSSTYFKVSSTDLCKKF